MGLVLKACSINTSERTKVNRNRTNHQEGARLEEQNLVCRHGIPTSDHHVNRLWELVVGHGGPQQGPAQGHLIGPRRRQGQVAHQLVPYVPGQVVARVRYGDVGHNHGLQELGWVDGVVLAVECLVCLQVDEAGAAAAAGTGCCYGNHRGGSRQGPGGEEGGLGGDGGVWDDVGEDEVYAGVGGLQRRDEEGGGGVVPRCGREGGARREQLHRGGDWGPHLSKEERDGVWVNVLYPQCMVCVCVCVGGGGYSSEHHEVRQVIL